MQDYPSLYDRDTPCGLYLIWRHKVRDCDMVVFMESPADQPALLLERPSVLPGGAMPRGREPDDIGAAFAADIALKSLDDLVPSELI